MNTNKPIERCEAKADKKTVSLDTIIGRVITSRCPERMWGGDAGIYSYERVSIAQEIRALCVIILVEVDRLYLSRS